MHPQDRSDEATEVTLLLRQASRGDSDAFTRLFPLVYDELKRLAESKLRFEREGHTLGPTALVHEAYLRLVGQTQVEWQSRSHFFAVAAQAMRRILVDYARQRAAGKRGGGAALLPLELAENVPDAGSPFPGDDPDRLLALDEALDRLGRFNPRGARVVEYRFFGGLPFDDIGAVMGMSEATARRAWLMARMWLHREIVGPAPDSSPPAG